MKPPKPAQGPDPAVHEAIGRLNRTELSPLEETMFQAWANANQIDAPDDPTHALDLRSLYQQTGGKMLPPGTLKSGVEKAGAIQTLMSAQKQHDAASPIKAMMDAQSENSMGSNDMAAEATPPAPDAGSAGFGY